jgi:hypothetical protein
MPNYIATKARKLRDKYGGRRQPNHRRVGGESQRLDENARLESIRTDVLEMPGTDLEATLERIRTDVLEMPGTDLEANTNGRAELPGFGPGSLALPFVFAPPSQSNWQQIPPNTTGSIELAADSVVYPIPAGLRQDTEGEGDSKEVEYQKMIETLRRENELLRRGMSFPIPAPAPPSHMPPLTPEISNERQPPLNIPETEPLPTPLEEGFAGGSNTLTGVAAAESLADNMLQTAEYMQQRVDDLRFRDGDGEFERHIAVGGKHIEQLGIMDRSAIAWRSLYDLEPKQAARHGVRFVLRTRDGYQNAYSPRLGEFEGDIGASEDEVVEGSYVTLPGDTITDYKTAASRLEEDDVAETQSLVEHRNAALAERVRQLFLWENFCAGREGPLTSYVEDVQHLYTTLLGLEETLKCSERLIYTPDMLVLEVRRWSDTHATTRWCMQEAVEEVEGTAIATHDMRNVYRYNVWCGPLPPLLEQLETLFEGVGDLLHDIFTTVSDA